MSSYISNLGGALRLVREVRVLAGMFALTESTVVASKVAESEFGWMLQKRYVSRTRNANNKKMIPPTVMA